MKRPLTLAALAALTLAVASTAAAAEFTPNHLFVGCKNGRILEFGPGGDYVKTHIVAQNAEVDRLAFGPDGSLYFSLISQATVGFLRPDGSVGTALDWTDGLNNQTDIDFGPDGYLHVCNATKSEIIKWRPASGGFPEAKSKMVPEGMGNEWIHSLSFGPTGDMFITAPGQTGVSHFNATGQYLDHWYTSEGMVDGVSFTPGGKMLITKNHNTDKVLMRAFFFSKTFQSSDLDGVGEAICGPDGNVWVASFIKDRVIKADLSGNQLMTISHPSLDLPTCLAFAPHRFKARLNLKRITASSKQIKVIENKAVLSITPGSGRLMIALPDDPNDDDDAATCLSSPFMVLTGREVTNGPTEEKRHFTGTSRMPAPLLFGDTTLELVVRGEADAHGFYAPQKIKGQFSEENVVNSLIGTIKANDLLE